MTPAEFIAKWRGVTLSERAAAQQHFLDVCDLVGHPKPAEADKDGSWFTFERGAAKAGGGDGWADVWKKGFFGWEYKGRHKSLDKAYAQLLQYREALENPPLLVVSDTDRIVVRTNFTATPTQIYEIALENLGEPRNLEILRAVFHNPEALRPGATSAVITEEAARRIAEIAQALRGRGVDPHRAARFLDRVVFCLFAEDIGLLPEGLFTRLLDRTRTDPARFQKLASDLFGAMARGGDFGVDPIRRFDGGLFDDPEALELTPRELDALHRAARLDWSAVDPSIFGTLFERGMDPAKRSQLGAHYTSRADIETLVEPVVLAPLRREWARVRELCENLLRTGRKHPKGGEPPPGPRLRAKARGEAGQILHRFLNRLARVKVLDPACGSGNFLYVTLQKLKDLEKEALVFAMDRGLGSFLPQVGPWQLYGIEKSPYAHELAQMAVWVGYLQWTRANGYGWGADPVLRPLEQNFLCRDAILDLSDPEHPAEPEWPAVDCIVGNPPFLGGKKLRAELGDDYVDALFRVYRGRVPAEADLCAYWLEKARAAVERGRCRRAGLLATQGIRGGANRRVLERIKETGDIFFAESDRDWILDGAAVHVSMVGFDDGEETERVLDGRRVDRINADLTARADLTRAVRLPALRNLAFMGDTKGGPFDLPADEALPLLGLPNPHGRPNSDVLVPWVNGLDVTRRPRDMWIVDFGCDLPEEEAARYEAPFELARRRVRPKRLENRRAAYRDAWWRHVEPRPAMRAALAPLGRFVATARVAKHRIFVWVRPPTLPDCQLIVFATDDDFWFGVLHSRFHEVWALRMGTQLEDRPRYTPTSCFETFPLPEAPADARRAVAEAARDLDELRERWLNPPEWTRQEVLEFPGSVDGPWARHVTNPDERGIGTVRYARRVPADPKAARELKRRTLTNLYNERPRWLDLAHRRLDEAVAAAYGWPADLGDDEILERLLALNRERARDSGEES
ncbi:MULTISPECIES: class I SAM-dependent DNA methyltransferase [Deferrisoma]